MNAPKAVEGVDALAQLIAHHEAMNTARGRPLDHSLTLRLARQAQADFADLIEAVEYQQRIADDRLVHQYEKTKAFLRVNAALSKIGAPK